MEYFLLKKGWLCLIKGILVLMSHYILLGLGVMVYLVLMEHMSHCLVLVYILSSMNEILWEKRRLPPIIKHSGDVRLRAGSLSKNGI
jgi:hypothetical protein